MTIVYTPTDQRKEVPLVESASTRAQYGAELECQPFFVDLSILPASQTDHLRETGLLDPTDASSTDICLLRVQHIQYLSQVWTKNLRPSFVSLDASRPWILYWCLHGCDLLGHMPTIVECQGIVSTLAACWSTTTIRLPRQLVAQDPFLSRSVSNAKDTTGAAVVEEVELVGGGFGGGPGQLPHAATTYAAVLALCILATSDNSSTAAAAYALLESKRLHLYPWLLSLKDTATASFRMHHDGEVDVRATYTVLTVAGLLNISTNSLTTRAIEYVAACQTFEGGFGGEPDREAHGGYSFCATAAVQLLNGWSSVDVAALTGWLARRQMSFEGGFNGRSNKLVDGCYSFWQGGALAIVSKLYSADASVQGGPDPWLQEATKPSTTATREDTTYDDLLFDQGMLQRYILLCAQDVHGGLRDKPSSFRDFYHSCYNLSGLSVTQYGRSSGAPAFGHAQLSRVAQTHPVYNIRIDRVSKVLAHFSELGLPK